MQKITNPKTITFLKNIYANDPTCDKITYDEVCVDEVQMRDYHDDHPLTIAILVHTLLRPNPNTFLHKLNFYGAYFSSISIQTLINALTKTDQITELAFSYCYIPQDQSTLQSFSSYIQSTSTLTFFSMEANKFNNSNDPLLIHLLPALTLNTSLLSLVIGSITFGTTTLPHWKNLLTHNKTLRILKLHLYNIHLSILHQINQFYLDYNTSLLRFIFNPFIHDDRLKQLSNINNYYNSQPELDEIILDPIFQYDLQLSTTPNTFYRQLMLTLFLCNEFMPHQTKLPIHLLLNILSFLKRSHFKLDYPLLDRDDLYDHMEPHLHDETEEIMVYQSRFHYTHDLQLDHGDDEKLPPQLTLPDTIPFHDLNLLLED